MEQRSRGIFTVLYELLSDCVDWNSRSLDATDCDIRRMNEFKLAESS
jgi:hypothetical protein